MSKNKSTDETPSPPAFHPALVRKLIARHCEEQQQQEATTNEAASLPTMTSDAADAIGELLKIFVLEARERAAVEAEIEQEATLQEGDTIQVRPDHFSKIAAEMFMDFS